MLAHYHGQVWNASAFARAFGVADTTPSSFGNTPARSGNLGKRHRLHLPRAGPRHRGGASP